MGNVINIFSREAIDSLPPPPAADRPSLRQDHFGFCGEDLFGLFTVAACFLTRQADYHIYYASKLKTIRTLQRDNILPIHAHVNIKELHNFALSEDFESIEKIEKDLRHEIDESERQRERWGDSPAEWIRATASIDCVRTSILQDTTALLDQAVREVFLRRSECRELVRLAEKESDDLMEYSIAFLGTKYKGPAEFYLQNLIDERLDTLGLKPKLPHLHLV
jgi:hypothetical protein